jgi:hypothetical protein
LSPSFARCAGDKKTSKSTEKGRFDDFNVLLSALILANFLQIFPGRRAQFYDQYSDHGPAPSHEGRALSNQG